jgi:phytoene dehydrogenase-like protein
MKTDFDVIVVGGGLAGLAAAATATRDGASTVVLEAHQPGGRARTTERNGFVFNNGVHALFTGGPGMSVLNALDIRLQGSPPPLGQYMLLAAGSKHVLPLGPESLEQTTFFDGADKAQFGALAGRMAAVDPASLQGLSIGDWLADQDLRHKVDAVVRALFRLSTYAADLDRFAADAALAQQQAAARGGVLYLDDGWSQLVRSLSAGTDLRTGAAVRNVSGDATGASVHTDDGMLSARAVIVATGNPQAARAILADVPDWGPLGEPVTAACLDAGVHGVPTPGYVVGIDDPLYGTVQSPPARQSSAGTSVVGIIRYGARSAAQDRDDLQAHLREMGVADQDVVERRFLARMIVSGAMPIAATGGLAGRPSITATGARRVFLAGDWVGPHGLLADAALASGQAAARAALRAVGAGSVNLA